MVIASLIVVSLIFKFLGINSLAGDIIQDLKTGHIVGANPKKQFIGEFIGIFTAYLFITWVVGILGDVYGFGSQNLPSPQGVLMGTITKGIFEGDIEFICLEFPFLVLKGERENISPSGMI